MLNQTRVFLCGLLVSVNFVASAQNPAPKHPPAAILNRCEGSNSDLAGVNQIAGRDGLIIAIARLGDGERSRQLNRRRLHNVRTFLAEFWNRDPTTVITAEGDKVKGHGRIDLYVRGELILALAVRHNGDLLVGSCVGPDRNLYPYLGKTKVLVKELAR